MFVANYYSLVTGISKNNEYEIISFDNALLDAKVGDYNIVKVSSILPPECSYSPLIKQQRKGAVLHMTYASLTAKGSGFASSAVAVGIPQDSKNIGVIMEYSCLERKQYCLETVNVLVKEAMEKRRIVIKDIFSIGCEIELSSQSFSTTFAGLAMW